MRTIEVNGTVFHEEESPDVRVLIESVMKLRAGVRMTVEELDAYNASLSRLERGVICSSETLVP